MPIGPAWSIGAEVGFYILIPISAWIALRAAARLQAWSGGSALGVAAAGVAMLVSIVLRAKAGDQYSFAWLTSPPAIMYVFMPGVAIAIAEPLLAALAARQPAPGARARLGARSRSRRSRPSSTRRRTTTRARPRSTTCSGQRALLAALCTGALILGLVVLQLGTGGAPRLFANRLMLWMGERSYSFYLVHIWVLLEIDHALGDGRSLPARFAIMVAVGLPLTTAIAALSYRYVERPFLERKRKVVAGGEGPGGSGLPPDAHSVPVTARVVTAHSLG